VSGGANWLDVLLAVVAAAATVFGLIRGFVRELVGIVAVLAGFILAAFYYPSLSSLLSGAISPRTTRDFLSFGIIFLVIVIAGALAARFISRHMGGMPRFVNHLLGGALGFLKGAFLCGVIVLGLAVWAKRPDIVLRSRLASPSLRVTTGLIQVAPKELKNKFRESYKRILEIKKGGQDGQKI
jgi:membrane protein required for colicin V production